MNVKPSEWPGYWVNETSGVLRPVVSAYLKVEPMTDEQIMLMRAYLLQWIDAPAWLPSPQLEELRRSVRKLSTREDIDKWIAEALAIGIDPL